MSIRYALILCFGLAASARPHVASAQTSQRQPQGDASMQAERQDLGVPPTRQLHVGAAHGATPASIPGGQVVTTQGVAALVQGGQAPFVLFDVLGNAQTLPGAVPAAWLAQAGSFGDAVQQQASQLFAQQTRGRKDVPLVFYCLSRECWMSYNAALRAIAAGYTNVLWYRGGIEAWQAAGLPTQQKQAQSKPSFVQPGQQPQQQPTQPQPQQDPRQAQRPAIANPGQFVQVKPVARDGGGNGNNNNSNNAAQPAGELRIGQGRFFSFALPPGWRTGEDGQHALTLISPDDKALTVMVGNAGSALNYPPARYATEKLASMQVQNLQLGPPRQARPAAGFAQAFEYDVSYSTRGVAYRGVAKVSIAPAYDTATLAMTSALSTADQWSTYASWLPRVSDQIAANNGAAFGARGVMQQNLRNSVAFGEAAREYRDWSQKNWQKVTDERNASTDRKNVGVREGLGGVQTFANPYGGNQTIELPTTSKYFWRNQQGNMVGTDNPSVNPNEGSTGDWRRMERVGR